MEDYYGRKISTCPVNFLFMRSWISQYLKTSQLMLYNLKIIFEYGIKCKKLKALQYTGSIQNLYYRSFSGNKITTFADRAYLINLSYITRGENSASNRVPQNWIWVSWWFWKSLSQLVFDDLAIFLLEFQGFFAEF